MRKGKYITSFFIVLLLVCTMNVNAETMSEAFKAVLNDNDKISLTYDGINSKDNLLSEYFNQFSNDESEYYFYTSVYDDCIEDYTKCNVKMYNRETNDLLEENEVIIDYNEVYSDEFLNIFTDNKLVVEQTTLLDDKNQIINNNLKKYKTDDYYFEVDFNEPCNEDFSKCTIVLSSSNGIQERHRVDLVYQEKYSDEFEQFVNGGKITITESSLINTDLLNEYVSSKQKENYMFQLSNCNEDSSKCDAIIYNYETDVQESHVVDIIYEEKYSDEFNQFAKDGKLVINWTKTDNELQLINDYVNSFNNQNYYFVVQDCNEDYSKCNGILNSLQDNKTEKHVIDIVFEEKYSDEFQKLTKDGIVSIPFTTTGDIKEVIYKYVYNISLTDGYSFSVNECNENVDVCKVVLYKNFYQIIEKHDIKIKYEEKYSDKFKKITADGNLVITSTGNKNDIIYQQLHGFNDEKTSFNVQYCNDDYTKCTVYMNEQIDNGFYITEMHIVNISYEEKYSDEFKKITTDGTLVIESIKSEEFDSEFLLTAKIYDLIDNSKYNGYGICDENLECNITIQSDDGKIESHNVKITIKEPSKEIQTNVENVVKNMKKFDINENFDKKKGYILDDLYLINYYNSIRDLDNFDYYSESKALKFSKELIDITKGSNISFKIDLRAGDSIDLWNFAFGKAIVYYNDIAYTTVDAGLTKIHVLYIPSDTANTKEAYVKAAQLRIDNYFGKNDIKVTYSGLLSELDEYNFEGDLIDTTKTDGNYYNIKIGEKNYSFVFIKTEQDKLEVPSYLGSDLISNVSVSSQEAEIPLDTSLTVKRIQDEQIEKILETNNYLAYDIKLFSSAKGVNITKLSNGKFKVSIPVSDSLNNKEITTYYIDENNQVIEYETKVENGVASFETDHFSIYTLAEKKTNTGNESGNTNNSGNNSGSESGNTNNSNNNNESGNINTPGNSSGNNQTTEQNPQTYDDIMIWFTLGFVSMIGIVGMLIYKRKQKI